MVMKEVILSILGILLAFPSGYLLAVLARDELVKGRKFFEILIIASLIVLFSSILIENKRLTFSIVLTMTFTIIISLISLYKSYDRRFVRN